MYSRKFIGQDSLPPNYGGVAYLRSVPDESPAQDPKMRPRRPLYENGQEQITRKIPDEPAEITAPVSVKERREKEEPLFSRRTFTTEDIAIAGLLLLLLTEKDPESNGDLLLLLGFLLLAGLSGS